MKTFAVAVVILACAGCAGMKQAKQRERERAAMIEVIHKAAKAQSESVRRQRGQLVADWPRLFASWDAIDMSGCPADFCAAWDAVVDGFKRASEAVKGSESTFLPRAAALAASLAGPSTSPWLSVLSTAMAGRDESAEVQRASGELRRALDRLKRVLERYGISAEQQPGAE